jgi:hypothetical protein
MSWDHILKSIKCPCGEGTIEKDTRSDDWGRYEEGTPYIKCPKCNEKYKLVTISHSSPFSWKGGYTCHFLVDKSLDLSIKQKNKFPIIDEYELQKKDFSHFLIVGYRLDSLMSVQDELNRKTSVASLKGFASKIAKDRKRYVGSAKINEVRNDVNIAIRDYNASIVNREKLDEQDDLDRKAREEWENKVKKNGILLDI